MVSDSPGLAVHSPLSLQSLDWAPDAWKGGAVCRSVVGRPVESASHTCTTHDGLLLPPLPLRDAGRVTDVTVKAPCCRNAVKPKAAMTQLCEVQAALFAVEPCVYGICSAPAAIKPFPFPSKSFTPFVPVVRPVPYV